MLDFGRAFNYWVSTTHLASEGARLAAVDSAPGGDLQAYIRSKGGHRRAPRRGHALDLRSARGLRNPDGDKVGDPVEVTVSTDYQWLPILGLATTTIHGSAHHAREVLPTT